MIGVSVDSGAVRSITSMRPDEMAAMKSASVDISRMMVAADSGCNAAAQRRR